MWKSAIVLKSGHQLWTVKMATKTQLHESYLIMAQCVYLHLRNILTDTWAHSNLWIGDCTVLKASFFFVCAGICEIIIHIEIFSYGVAVLPASAQACCLPRACETVFPVVHWRHSRWQYYPAGMVHRYVLCSCLAVISCVLLILLYCSC